MFSDSLSLFCSFMALMHSCACITLAQSAPHGTQNEYETVPAFKELSNLIFVSTALKSFHREWVHTSVSVCAHASVCAYKHEGMLGCCLMFLAHFSGG
jgi:hypothetical protein